MKKIYMSILIFFIVICMGALFIFGKIFLSDYKTYEKAKEENIKLNENLENVTKDTKNKTERLNGYKEKLDKITEENKKELEEQERWQKINQEILKKLK